MSTVLSVQGLEVKYRTRDGTLTAIRDVGFDVKGGEILGVVGESGCGKSTVASALMRLLPPNGWISAGRILLRDRDLCQLPEKTLRRMRGRDLSMIFQDAMTSLNPVFSVEEQMVDALRAHGSGGRQRGRKALRQRAIEMLDRVGIPDAARQIKEYPHQFSGGMRQRIMIATALLSNPDLLIADEPTSALDVTLEAQIIDLIRGLRDDLGTSIVYITHDLGVVAQLCDQLVVMYAGGIVESGDVYTIFDNPQHPYTRALLESHPSRGAVAGRLRTIPGRVPSLRNLPPGCKFAPRCLHADETCETLEPGYIRTDGRRVLCHAIRPPREPLDAPSPGAGMTTTAPDHPLLPDQDRTGETIIETRGLRTHFRDHVALLGQLLGQKGSTVRAVDIVDLAVRRGEILGLVGESGSGKTTLGRTILRLEAPTDGAILIQGSDITNLPEPRIRSLRAKMQIVFQEPFASLSPRMKVSSLLLEPFRIHGIPVEHEREKVDELLAMVGLSAEQADKFPHQLSGGQARRVGIARALALDPDILVADEPTSGLDVSVAAGILNLLRDLQAQMNLACLVISHNLNVIQFIADRVAVMYLGRVVELADTQELFAKPRHPYTEALMSAISLPDPHLRDVIERIVLEGEIPSPRHPPSGCAFHPRCRYAADPCQSDTPALEAVGEREHLVACHFPDCVSGA